MRSKVFVAGAALAVACFVVPPHVGADEVGATNEGGAEVELSEAIAAETAAESESHASESEPRASDAELANAQLEPDLSQVEPPAAAAALTEPTPNAPLGAIGYDADGQQGRVHVVVTGDTLWDIAAAYLGTAWVWPSIWRDNEDIENPHLILPDDRIWITDTEMRRVTREEAEKLLAGRPVVPAELEPAPALEPVAPPEPEYAAPAPRSTIRIASRESADLISAEQLESSSSIVDAIPNRLMLSQGDRVYIGLGENDVAVGDQFTIFQTHEKVTDPDTEELLGYHVDMVGWVEVEETHPETSIAKIWRSNADIKRGDRLMPRQPPVLEVTVQESPEGVSGKLSFFSDSRTMTAQIDFVYLNRGSRDGLVVGSPLEVYREGYSATETARNEQVAVPPRTVASLIVVRANARSAVAFVRITEVELEIGDHFRGAEQVQAVASR